MIKTGLGGRTICSVRNFVTFLCRILASVAEINSGAVVVVLVWSSESVDSRNRYLLKGMVERRESAVSGFCDGRGRGGCSCWDGWDGGSEEDSVVDVEIEVVHGLVVGSTVCS